MLEAFGQTQSRPVFAHWLQGLVKSRSSSPGIHRILLLRQCKQARRARCLGVSADLRPLAVPFGSDVDSGVDRGEAWTVDGEVAVWTDGEVWW